MTTMRKFVEWWTTGHCEGTMVTIILINNLYTDYQSSKRYININKVTGEEKNRNSQLSSVSRIVDL